MPNLFPRPNNIPNTVPGCVAWIDPSDTLTITSSGGAVSEIRNKVNKSASFTQGTGANQPITGTSTINGLNALSLNGTSSRLSIPSNLFPDQTSGGLTMFVVAKISAVGSERYLVGSTNAPRTYMVVTSAGTAASYISSSSIKDSGVSVSTNPFVFCVTNDGAADTVALYVNNQGPVVFSQTNSGVPTNMVLGATTSGTSLWSGEIGEVIFYNRALSSTQLLLIRRYLSNKWGISGP